jgi:hypothetical protein
MGPLRDTQLHALLEYARCFSGARGASYFGIDSEGRDLVLRASTHRALPTRPTRFRAGEGLVGMAAASGRPYFCPEVARDPLFRTPPGPPPGTASLLCLPIHRTGGVEGVLNLTWSRRARPMPRADVEHLEGAVSSFLSRRIAPGERMGLAAQLASATRVQASWVPPPDLLPGLELQTLFRPLHPAGGDTPLALAKGDRLLVGVADLTGHDVGAGLGAAALRSLLRQGVHRGTGLEELVAEADGVLAEELLPGLFATLLLCELDLAAGRLSFTGCGHPPGLLDDPGQASPVFLDSRGCALGLGMAEPESTTVPFPEGATLLLYTDGAEPAFGGGARALATLASRLRDWREAPLAGLRGALARDLDMVPEIGDDATLLLVRRAMGRSLA